MWPGKAAVPLAAPVVPGDRLKSSEKVWPGENDARRRFAEGEGGAEGESSPDIMKSMGRRSKEVCRTKVVVVVVPEQVGLRTLRMTPLRY